MSLKWIWIAFFFIMSYANESLTQQERLHFDHVSIADGLSQSTVYDIIKDYQGFIWIATAGGLNRYDGLEIKTYITESTDESLSSIYTEKLFEDSHDNLWITTNDGINRYNREKDTFHRYFPSVGNVRSEAYNSISDIIQDHEGDIWISSRNKDEHLFSYDEQKDEFVNHSLEYISYALNRIVQYDEEHLLLAFENKQLYLYNKATRKAEFTGLVLPREALSMKKDSQHKIWIGTDGEGLYSLDKIENGLTSYAFQSNARHLLRSDVIWDIEILNNDDLWLATDNGLHYYDQSDKVFITHQYHSTDPTSISSNFLLCAYQDRDEILWVGSSEAGLNVLHPSTRAFEHYSNKLIVGKSLSNNAVWSISEADNDHIWIGTSEGLNKLNTINGNIESYYSDNDNNQSISHNRIWAIEKDPFDNCFWLGTSGGLNLMKLNSENSPIFSSWMKIEGDSSSISSNSVRCLNVEAQGIWVGTSSEGLNYFDKKTGLVTRYYHDIDDSTSLSNNRVRQILRDSKNRLWIATQEGLNLYQDGQFKKYVHDTNDAQSISNNHIRVLKEDEDGNLWVGTDFGLNKVSIMEDLSLNVKKYNTSHGLSDNRIYAIELDSNFLWASTNNGLSRLNIIDETFDNFYQSDGLQSNEFNQAASYSDESGMLYFGGINGLNRFNPDIIEKRDDQGEIVFTDFKIHFKEVDINEDGPLSKHIIVEDEIHLNHNERMFSIQFSALNFRKNLSSRFAYRLVPFEEEWNDIGHLNQAVYTNIPPGEYTFQVKTSNYGNVWFDQIGQIKVVLHPAFWETLWFKILGLMALILTILGGYRYRIRSLIHSREELEHKVQERTHLIAQQKESLERTIEELNNTQDQLIEQEKMAIIGQMTAGIAHEINNPINYIANNTDALIMDVRDVKSIVERVLELSESDGSQAVKDLIKIREDVDLEYLVNEIEVLVKGIKTGAHRTTEIIKSLRYISYRDQQDKTEVNIHDSIDSALSILHSNYKDRISITKNYGSIPLVKAFSGELNQVFMNLINNSIQAIDGKGEVIISTSMKDEGHVQISIKDTGKGIPDDIQKHIFEPFYTTKEIGKGTGLGLSISYGIIESHNGKIDILSTEGKGSEFVVILPI